MKGSSFVEFSLTHFMRGLVDDLHDIVSHQSFDRILFLSREGLFIKQCYESRYGKDSRLFYALSSREVYRKAVIFSVNDAVDLLDVPCADRRLNDFFVSRFDIDISGSEYLELIRCSGFESSEIIINRRNDYSKLKSLVYLLFSDIFSTSKVNSNLLIQYLKSLGLQPNERILVVDIGYNGTSQKCLSKLMPSVEFYGYYLLTLQGILELPRSKYFSYFGENVYNRNSLSAFSRNIPVLEFLFMASHGTLKGFNDGGGGVEPVLDQQLSRSDLDIIFKIQQEVVFNVSDGQAILPKFFMSLFLNFPTRSTILWFQDCSLDDYYGGKLKRKLVGPTGEWGSATVLKSISCPSLFVFVKQVGYLIKVFFNRKVYLSLKKILEL